MTTKGPLRKQIIIPIESNNVKRIIAKANTHISNINKLLKRVKSEISVNFIQSNNKKLHITTNKVAATSYLNIIEEYIKDLYNINSNDIMSSKLS